MNGVANTDTIYMMDIVLPNGNRLLDLSGLEWGFGVEDTEPEVWYTGISYSLLPVTNEWIDCGNTLSINTDYGVAGGIPYYITPNGAPTVVAIGATHVYVKNGTYHGHKLISGAQHQIPQEARDIQVYFDTVIVESDSGGGDNTGHTIENLFSIKARNATTLEYLDDFVYIFPSGCEVLYEGVDVGGGKRVDARTTDESINVKVSAVGYETKTMAIAPGTQVLPFVFDLTPREVDPPTPIVEKIYRINVKRSDTHAMIGNENIWVGNTPNDGFSKQTSGQTLGETYSYVEFTWNELLKAIGEEPETIQPTITIEASDTVIPKSGGTITVTITVTNGVYERYEITSSRPSKSVVTPQPNKAIVTLTFPENDTGDEIRYTFIGHGRGVDDSSGLTCADSIYLTQTYDRWSLSDVDYVIFTYEWETEDGRDLDSFTFIDKLSTSSTGWCGEYFENGVGWSNGDTSNPEGFDKAAYYIHGSTYNDSILKFAGDNTSSGGEYTLIDFKKLNEKIIEGVNAGYLESNAKIIVYLMGCWYRARGNGYGSASFTAYKGGTVYREEIETGKIKYSISGDTEVKGSYREEGINVFSKSGVFSNSRDAIETYTTMAAFVYDYSNNSFSLVTNPVDLKSLDGGLRYKYGLSGTTGGNIEIYGATMLTRTFSFAPTLDVDVSNYDDERVYTIDFDGYLVSRTGSTPTDEIRSRIEFDSCETVPSTSADYDGDIVLNYQHSTEFTVKFPAGHSYSGQSEYGYRVKYNMLANDEYLRIYMKTRGGGDNYIDLRENLI